MAYAHRSCLKFTAKQAAIRGQTPQHISLEQGTGHGCQVSPVVLGPAQPIQLDWEVLRGSSQKGALFGRHDDTCLLTPIKASRSKAHNSWNGSDHRRAVSIPRQIPVLRLLLQEYWEAQILRIFLWTKSETWVFERSIARPDRPKVHFTSALGWNSWQLDSAE